MAAETGLVTANTLPACKRVTLPSSGDDLREFTLPPGRLRVTVYFVTNAGKLAFTGTDDQAIGTDYKTVAADTDYWFEVGRASNAVTSIYLTSATGSTVAEVTVERIG